MLHGLKCVRDEFGDDSLRKLAHALEAFIAEDGHDAGDDGDCDASSAAVVDPLVKDVVVVEELGYDEVGARVDLLLQVLDVIFARCRCQVDLRVASDADGEPVAIRLLDELDEVCGVVEAIVVVDPVGGAAGRVASQCEQVADAELLRPVEAVNDLFSCHKRTRDVHQDVHVHIFLNVAAELKRDIRGDAACIPRDIDPEGVGLRHAVDTVDQVFKSLVCLGRKVLERVAAANRLLARLLFDQLSLTVG